MVNLHKYLGELVEMTAHNLDGRGAREHFHLLGSKGLLRLYQRNPSIVPDTRRSRVSLVLQLVPSMLPLILKGNNLLNQGRWGGRPRRFSAWSNRGSQSDEGPLIHHLHSFGPKIRKGLILPNPHLGVHTLIKICRHPCKRKTLVKKKEKKKEKTVTSQMNTHSSSP